MKNRANPSPSGHSSCPGSGPDSQRVHNVLGQEVRTLVDRHQPANRYTVRWDGRDNSGKEVSNGVFIYKLCAGEFEAVKKMTMLR